MGELRNKVNAVSVEELEKITGMAFPDTFDNISTFLGANEADICDFIGGDNTAHVR